MDLICTHLLGCSCPTIYNGYTSNCTMYQKYGNSVSYYCLSGYHRIGSSNGICQSDGSWSPSPPTCVKREFSLYFCTFVCQRSCYYAIIYIGTPCLCPRQPNGYTSNCSQAATVGSHINYYCNSGYYLTGDSNVTCLPHGNWTANPVCEKGMHLQNVYSGFLIT